jgi:hypothetical protein
MVEVMALGDEEGGDSPRPVRPPLEHLLPQEQDAPLPEQDALDIAVVDLCAPLDHIVDPVQVAEALERTRLVLLSKVAEDEDARRRMSTKLRDFYDAQDVTPAGLVHGLRRTMDTLLRVQAGSRSSSCHHQAKAQRDAARAVAAQAAMAEATAPSREAVMDGNAKSRLQRLR